MKTLLINISLRPDSARKHLPIGLGYIATAIKNAGFSCDIMDLVAHYKTNEEIEEFFQNNSYDVVAMGCIVTGYKYIKYLSNVIKTNAPQTRIIVGNTVAQSIPDILLLNNPIDIGVMGEGDQTIVDLLKCIKESGDLKKVQGIFYREDGKIHYTEQRPMIKDIDSIPSPDWNLFDVEIYIKNLSESVNEPLPPIPRDKIRAITINTARGCPFKCTFCYHIFRDSKYRHRSPDSIINEMQLYKDLYGINLFIFNDELSFFSLKQAEQFADTLLQKKLNFFWTAECRGNLFATKEDLRIAQKLKDAGCLSMAFSLESAEPEILKWMNKGLMPEDFSKQVKILKQAGIPSLTSVVIGYPNETEDSIRKTLNFCLDNNIYPSVGYLLPQPGSEMYQYSVDNGLITDEEDYFLTMGDRQDLRINMTKLSDEQLTQIVEDELFKCSQALGLNMDKRNLIKTRYYRSPKK